VIATSSAVGVIYNVLINLKEIKDEKFNYDMGNTCAELKGKAHTKLTEVLQFVEKKL
jgi:formiminotetrahydrofolate cyclodeaminase